MSGIQHGLDLAARLMLDPGDPVSLEDPCHSMISAMFTDWDRANFMRQLGLLPALASAVTTRAVTFS